MRPPRPPRAPLVLALLLAGAALASPATAVTGPAPGTLAQLGPRYPVLMTIDKGTSVQGVVPAPDGKLYLYGLFDNAGGDPTADGVAVYDPVDGSVRGLGGTNTVNGPLGHQITDVAIVNGTVYAAGPFTQIANGSGTQTAFGLAEWDGTDWSPAFGIRGTFQELEVVGSTLFAAGRITRVGATTITNGLLARLDGSTWSLVDDVPTTNDGVGDMRVLADGRLLVVGTFTDAGANPDADDIAVVSPATGQFQALVPAGSFTTGHPRTAVFLGTRLFIGGNFIGVGGNPLASHVVEWTGTAFKALGNGGSPSLPPLAVDVDPPQVARVVDLEVSGTNLLVRGSFVSAGGLDGTTGIAAWNGTKWMGLNAYESLPLGDGGIDILGRTAALCGTEIDNFTGLTTTKGVGLFGLPGNPSAPRSLVGASRLKAVRLTWAAPASSNGSPITDYTIQFRVKGTTVWKTFADGVSATRAATVTGLKSGVTFQFRVRARTDWGIGGFSTIISAKAG